MKRSAAMLFLSGLLLLVAGCSSSEEAATPTPDPVVETTETPDVRPVDQAIKLAKAIQADPDHAEDVLAQAGLSIEDFESLLVAVASNPKDAAAYTQAVN